MTAEQQKKKGSPEVLLRLVPLEAEMNPEKNPQAACVLAVRRDRSGDWQTAPAWRRLRTLLLETEPRLRGSRRFNALEDTLLLLPRVSLKPLNVTWEPETRPTSPPPSEQTFTTEVRIHSDGGGD